MSRSEQIGSADGRMRRFVLLFATYGGAVGAVTMIVSLLSRTPELVEPERLDLVAGLFIYGGGAAAGILVGALVAAAVHFEGHRWSLGIFPWLLLGLGYGLAFALLAGGLFSPLSTVVLDFYRGVADPVEVSKELSNIVVAWPVRAITGGATIMFSAALVGVLFGAGAWVIDRFYTSAHQPTARRGSWVVSIALGLFLLTVATLASPEFLSRFG